MADPLAERIRLALNEGLSAQEIAGDLRAFVTERVTEDKLRVVLRLADQECVRTHFVHASRACTACEIAVVLALLRRELGGT